MDQLWEMVETSMQMELLKTRILSKIDSFMLFRVGNIINIDIVHHMPLPNTSFSVQVFFRDLKFSSHHLQKVKNTSIISLPKLLPGKYLNCPITQNSSPFVGRYND